MSRAPSPVFDVSLPDQHSYLGGNLNDLQGSTFTEEDTIITIPLLEIPDVFLAPGQIIPLQVRRPLEIQMFNSVLQGNRLFGFKFPKNSHGTVAEIRSISDTNANTDELALKAKGTSVFKITETWRDAGGVLMARVLILPDEDTPHPLFCNCLLLSRGFKYNAKLLPVSTGTPLFIYSMYEPYTLQRRILNYFKEWASWRLKVEDDQSNSFHSNPSSPRDFSYWVTANLPLQDEDRLSCLTLRSSIQRLRILLRILQSMNSICCKSCKQVFCSKEDIFSLSHSGPQGTFVNSGGYVHETVTVYKSDSLRTSDEPSSEFSWFPGYQWTICYCENCFEHIGWKFTVESGRKLKPNLFWALRRKSIQLTYKKNLPRSSSLDT